MIYKMESKMEMYNEYLELKSWNAAIEAYRRAVGTILINRTWLDGGLIVHAYLRYFTQRLSCLVWFGTSL